MRESEDLVDWEPTTVRAVPLTAFGESYRRYRVPDASAEGAVLRSLARYGQMSPVVVCLREERPQIVDGFKRLAAAQRLPRWETLTARLLVADERGAKAAI